MFKVKQRAFLSCLPLPQAGEGRGEGAAKAIRHDG